MPRCSHCGSQGGDFGLVQQGEDFWLCEDCDESYGRYLDDNAQELAAQERYENFMAEC